MRAATKMMTMTKDRGLIMALASLAALSLILTGFADGNVFLVVLPGSLWLLSFSDYLSSRGL